MNDTSILDENIKYWSNRAASYSDVSKWELNGESIKRWSQVILSKIDEHFPNSQNNIKILEVGTGPGFFAILLAKAGYHVTAIDLTPNMLAQARQNAGELISNIDFMEMNAENLEFEDGSYDMVISRNLTWNLPHPEVAYSQWCRVLKKGGLLLNFDANWYNYLFDEDAKEAYEQDRINTAKAGLEDQNVGENFDIMEGIAKQIPLSSIKRPEWDAYILQDFGMNFSVDLDAYKKVWTTQEQLNFSSTPMFMIEAFK